MRLGQTSAIYLISKFGGSILGFFATIYFTRTLGEDIYGVYAITLAIVSWLGLVKSIGFGQAIVKRMSESEEPDAYFSAGVVVKATLLVFVVSLVALFRDQINMYVGQPVAEFVVLLLIVSTAIGVVNSALRGTHRVHIYAPLTTAKQGAQGIVMVALVYAGWELSGMLLGHAIGTALIALAGLWFLKPTLVVPKWQHITKLFDFAKFSWLGSMRKKTFSDMDILVLGLFVPSGFTGVYAVAYTLSKFPNIFGGAIQTTLFPELSKRSETDDDDMVQKLTNDALTYAGLFMIPSVVGGILIGDRLMRVYGEGFEIGAQVLSILLFGILIYTYTRQLLNTLNGIDRPDLAFRANAIFIGANLVLNFTLVYSIGWVGAAIATATSAGVGFVFAFYYARQHVAFTVPFGEMARQWTAALGMGITVYLVRQLIETNVVWFTNYNSLFVVGLVGLGAFVYFGLLFAISAKFRSTVTDNMPFEIPVVNKYR